MSLKGSIEQAKTFAKVTDSPVKRRAFLEYVRTVRKIAGPGVVTPRKLIWCPCKARGYFSDMSRKCPAGPAKNAMNKLLSKI